MTDILFVLVVVLVSLFCLSLLHMWFTANWLARLSEEYIRLDDAARHAFLAERFGIKGRELHYIFILGPDDIRKHPMEILSMYFDWKNEKWTIN